LRRYAPIFNRVRHVDLANRVEQVIRLLRVCYGCMAKSVKV
jgi:hypothetical protein